MPGIGAGADRAAEGPRAPVIARRRICSPARSRCGPRGARRRARFSLPRGAARSRCRALARPRVARRRAARCSPAGGGAASGCTRSTAACSRRSIGTAGARGRRRSQEPPQARPLRDVHVRARRRPLARRARARAGAARSCPATRAPPQGARLSVLGIAAARRPDLRARVAAPSRRPRRAARVDAGAVAPAARRRRRPPARAGSRARRRPVSTGERRAVLEGVVLGEDGGLSDSLRQRFRASGLYHLLAVSGGNVLVVAGGAVGARARCSGSRGSGRRSLALAAIAAYVLAVGPQPSVIRAGVAGALAVARVADRPAARPLVRAARRGGRAPRLEPVERARPGLPALVRRGRLDLRARAALPAGARGLPDARVGCASCIAISAACGLCTAPISWLHFHAIPLLTVPANAAAAPVVAPMLALALARGDRAARSGPLLAQLNGLVRRLPRGLRALLRRAPGRAGPLARGGRRARVGRAPRGRLCLASWRAS